ncbi:MAG TPA: hypothetical protein VGG99_30090 [Acetobacteraceae bacterium]
MAIRQGGRPLAGLLPGWTARRLFRVDSTVALLELRHTDGRDATWYLDQDLNMVANSLRDVPEPERRLVVDASRDAIQALWLGLVETASASPTDLSATTDFLALNRSARAEIAAELEAELCPSAQSTVLNIPPGSLRPDADAALAGSHSVTLEARHLRAILGADMLKAQVDAARHGRLVLPSPVDGHPVECTAVFCVSPSILAFRFVDDVHGLPYFVFAFEFEVAAYIVYFPTLRRAIYPDQPREANSLRYLNGTPEHVLFTHIVRYGEKLGAYMRRPRRPAVTIQYVHLGHHLWNELTGLNELVRQVPAANLPPVLVGYRSQTEMYGKIDELYPELAGKVFRFDHAEQLIETTYNNGYLLLHPTGMWVARDLAARIIRVAEREQKNATAALLLDGLSSKGFHRILLGLRVENRTVVEFDDFCVDLVQILHEEMGRVAIVVDGQNGTGTGVLYHAHAVGRAGRSPYDVELDIVAKLRQAFASNPDVMILSTIGEPIAVSICLCNEAEFFVTPHGAGLAKYRWVCNRPGLALAGNNFRATGPIHLYDSPVFMEAPTKMYFTEQDDSEDRPEAPQLVKGGHPHYVNYHVQRDALRNRLRAMISELADPCTAKEI